MFLAHNQNATLSNERRSKMGIEIKRFPMRIEGHRGAGHLEPENSLKAFIRAAELGIDGVELDVWLTRDGIPVVVHGLSRGYIEFEGGVKELMTNIDSSALPGDTLKNGEKIPTLAEVLDICRDRISVNIEIKEARDEVIEKVLPLIQERDMFDQITFSSFNHGLRKKLASEVSERQITSKVSFGYLMQLKEPNFPNYEETLPGDSINVDIRFLEQRREECHAEIQKAQENQVKVKFWFPMAYAEEHMFYGELMSLAVDTVITNKPIVMIDYFRSQQPEQQELAVI